MRLSSIALVLAAASPAIAAPGVSPVEPVPVVGGPCEGCENVFRDIPAEIGSAARIASADQPGEPLRIEGTVYGPGGQPAPGTIVYAYHTDVGGLYPPAETRHGALRGWARADGDGRYRFDTMRPGGYPGTSIPQHVHMHVIEPGRCTYFIDDLLFRDDPRLTPARERGMVRGRGGPGVADPQLGEDGTWIAVRDIRLGENVPGHPGHSAK